MEVQAHLGLKAWNPDFQLHSKGKALALLSFADVHKACKFEVVFQ